jgi:hypothetical protein
MNKKYLAMVAMAAALMSETKHLNYEHAKNISSNGIGSLSRHKAKMKCKKYCK